MKLIINNKRKYSFYWYYIHPMTNSSIDVIPQYTNPHISTALIKAKTVVLIKNKTKTDKEKVNEILNEILNEIEALYNRSLLNENELIWIKQNNSRLTNWLWFLITQNKNPLTLFYKYINTSKYEYDANSVGLDFFDYFSFNKKAYSTKEKDDLILQFFELSSMNRNDKISLINKLRDIWNEIITIDDFKWIISNDDNIYEWAINYFIEYNVKNSNYITDIKNISFENDFHKLVLLIDSWDAHVDTKKLFIQSIKKAYSQKKFRDKQVGKKQCSFNLSQKSINQLALLSELQGVPKNHILESLINHKILELGVKQ
ncbi:hypothetical protein C0W96_01095 [Photobacterium kishitanii]|uniref:hypothetical protein n=1 Tax=Photobacterium kishitanii TaxID=318456 RepID=UPI0005D35087|nr:hypothetical protein [Photobacterium kishitanii]KJG09527.1 hypothetical protein UB40_12490 [Photobacterium kishitanii]PSV07879.1 hypothetical protein C0W96_01095 [Photobacterium kishitanii]PSV76367.1 hypothetical protein C0W29_08335 [Photobacterium kishitanii]